MARTNFSINELPTQEFKQFIADLTRNCRHYPIEFTEQELTIKPIAIARKDPLNLMWWAMQQAHLI